LRPWGTSRDVTFMLDQKRERPGGDHGTGPDYSSRACARGVSGDVGSQEGGFGVMQPSSRRLAARSGLSALSAPPTARAPRGGSRARCRLPHPSEGLPASRRPVLSPARPRRRARKRRSSPCVDGAPSPLVFRFGLQHGSASERHAQREEASESVRLAFGPAMRI
jgi:hypothetical protein